MRGLQVTAPTVMTDELGGEKTLRFSTLGYFNFSRVLFFDLELGSWALLPVVGPHLRG